MMEAKAMRTRTYNHSVYWHAKRHAINAHAKHCRRMGDEADARWIAMEEERARRETSLLRGRRFRRFHGLRSGTCGRWRKIMVRKSFSWSLKACRRTIRHTTLKHPVCRALIAHAHSPNQKTWAPHGQTALWRKKWANSSRFCYNGLKFQFTVIRKHS